MRAYYNEWDAYPAQWIRNLVAAGHVAPGEVDERSIKEVQPADVGDGQVHLFAGIAVWSYALRLAGYPDDFPVWTASCPCQPFSAAGRGAGVDDPRHLWPDAFRLIDARRPAVVVGEQVASKDGLAWLDLVCADMERAGYAFRAIDFCAAGVGAPHVRQRLWWVGIRPSYARSLGVAGFGAPGGAGEMRPWGAFGEMDLRALLDRPYGAGARHPQPLLRSVDDGAASRVGRLRAYGNAIVPQVAAEFLEALKPLVLT